MVKLGVQTKSNCTLLHAEHLAGLLAQQSSALASGGLACTIHQGATHTEAAWASRMPNALRHLCSTWWAHVAESEAHGRLYFTLPRRLRGGQQALLFFNQVL